MRSDLPLDKFTFITKKLGNIDYSATCGTSCWKGSRVGVFKVPIITTTDEHGNESETIDRNNTNPEFVGEYEYNFCFDPALFFAFKRSGHWFALYSKDYTASRVMRIFQDESGKWTFEDWCGEERNNSGFCPVEFYVPDLHDSAPVDHMDYFDPCDLEVDEEKIELGDIIRTYKINYGFVSGCHWGDDSSNKLQLIDLSQIENKILKREDRFGYLELPNIPIVQLINVKCSAYICGYNRRIIKISGLQYDLDSGELLAEHLKIATKNKKLKEST